VGDRQSGGNIFLNVNAREQKQGHNLATAIAKHLSPTAKRHDLFLEWGWTQV